MDFQYLSAVHFTRLVAKFSGSVRPNTEYSAEYSAKNRRIFGTEYSAKSADTPITENRVKMAVFDPFQLKFWSNFG